MGLWGLSAVYSSYSNNGTLNVVLDLKCVAQEVMKDNVEVDQVTNGQLSCPLLKNYSTCDIMFMRYCITNSLGGRTQPQT